MKKIIVVCIATLLMSIAAIENANAQKFTIVNASGNWGRQSKNCSGFGICGLQLDIFVFTVWTWGDMTTNNKGGENTPAKTSIDESNNIFILNMSIKDLKKTNEEAYNELMDKGLFVLEKDITLPVEANKDYKLKRSNAITLKANSYKAKIDGDLVTVNIEIK